MSIETLHNNNYVEYTDREGNLCYRSPEEQAEIDRNAELKDFLDHSSLSDEDLQYLRSISAEYAVVCAPIPEADAERKEVLDYLMADIPVLSKADNKGLRRFGVPVEGIALAIDGKQISVEELEYLYMAIEPSADVLDRAVEEAALDHMNMVATEQPTIPQVVEAEEAVADQVEVSHEDVIVSVPHHEVAHPVTDRVKHFSHRVLEIVGVH